MLKDGGTVDILPALGTHVAITEKEWKEMFGDISYDKFIYHNWREDIVKIGEVSGVYLSEITDGLWKETIDTEKLYL